MAISGKYLIRRTITTADDKKYELHDDIGVTNFNNRYFDARLYHMLALTNNKTFDTTDAVPAFQDDDKSAEDYGFKNGGKGLFIYPYHTYASFSGDYYESEDAIVERIAELEMQIDAQKNRDVSGGFDGQEITQVNTTTEKLQKMVDDLKIRYALVKDFNLNFEGQMLAPHSLIHPYAIVKLAGAHGSEHTAEGLYVFDNFATRKWYEVDGDNISSYAKNPTTTRIISWSTEDELGRTPYSYQDFVFCKNWNVVPNNRMITLRRYFAPVTDNLEFDNYKHIENVETIPYEDARLIAGEKALYLSKPMEKVKNMGFSPLATAVTYFGENTGNELSSLLNFSVKYNWTDVKAQSSPITIDAEANDMGQDLINSDGFGILSSAMKAMSYMTGFSSALSGNLDPMSATRNSMPPDPYGSGPYENRILGPVNVIMDTVKRERGLRFTHDGLKVTFSYVSRPIAGINNKAVLLDLLCNMLIMCYASGTWFGGIERFRTRDRKTYPFKYGDVMNRLYKGQLFGKNSATNLLAQHAWEAGTGQYGLMDIFGEALKGMKNLVSGMLNEMMAVVNGALGNKEKSDEQKVKAKERFNAGLAGKAVTGVQRVLAGRILKGATIPWVNNKKALLTGDAVGEWHLTIGNPLNPIAMIGNLICDGLEIKWSDELGPDDFPIGFDAIVTLKHAMGRDRDAVESMFNRGYGRIYSLPNMFRSSADYETSVDKWTGPQNRDLTKYDEWSATYFGGGGVSISDQINTPLANRGNDSILEPRKYGSLMPLKSQSRMFRMSKYVVTPFQMKWVL